MKKQIAQTIAMHRKMLDSFEAGLHRNNRKNRKDNNKLH